MSWSTVLEWPASTSGGQPGGEELSLAWSFAVRSASWLLSLRGSTFSRLKTCDLTIIGAGGSYGPNCSRVKRRVGSSSAFVKIRLRIWLPWKLNFSSEVFRSAKKRLQPLTKESLPFLSKYSG